jgi:hypothetical protein
MPLGVLIFFAASLFAGAVTRRWLAVVVVVVPWPVYYAGLLVGIWGSGVGNGWAYAAVLLTASCAGGGVAGVLLGRTLVGPPPAGRKRTNGHERLLL